MSHVREKSLLSSELRGWTSLGSLSYLMSTVFQGLSSLFSVVSGLKKPKYFFTNTSTAAVLASKYWNMDEFKLTGETPHSC